MSLAVKMGGRVGAGISRNQMGSLDVQVFMDVEMRHRVRTSTSRTTESRIPGVSGCQVGADTRRTRSTSLDTQVFLDTTMGWQIEAGTSRTRTTSPDAQVFPDPKTGCRVEEAYISYS